TLTSGLPWASASNGAAAETEPRAASPPCMTRRRLSMTHSVDGAVGNTLRCRRKPSTGTDAILFLNGEQWPYGLHGVRSVRGLGSMDAMEHADPNKNVSAGWNCCVPDGRLLAAAQIHRDHRRVRFKPRRLGPGNL